MSPLLPEALFNAKSSISAILIASSAYRLQDLSGYGVATAVRKEFSSSFPDRVFLSPLIDLLRKNGRDGNRSILLKFLRITPCLYACVCDSLK